jgi:hypothetical protein
MMHRVIESAGNNTKDKTKGSFHEGGWRTLNQSDFGCPTLAP